MICPHCKENIDCLWFSPSEDYTVHGFPMAEKWQCPKCKGVIVLEGMREEESGGRLGEAPTTL